VTFSKHKNECLSTYTIYSKMSPPFWITQYFGETNFLKNQNIILTCNQKKKYLSSVSILWSRKFLQMLKTVALFIASTSSPQRETHIRASRVFKFNLLRRWLLIAICLKNCPSQKTILDGMSIAFCQIWINLGQFVCHSKFLPHMRQASDIVLFSHSCQIVFINSRSSPLHMSLSSSVY
jgi:hypothetical protein